MSGVFYLPQEASLDPKKLRDVFFFESALDEMCGWTISDYRTMPLEILPMISLCRVMVCFPSWDTCGGAVARKTQPDLDSDNGDVTEGEEENEQEMKILSQVLENFLQESVRAFLVRDDVLGMRMIACECDVVGFVGPLPTFFVPVKTESKCELEPFRQTSREMRLRSTFLTRLAVA